MSVSADQITELRDLLGEAAVLIPVKQREKKPWDNANNKPLFNWTEVRPEQMTEEYLKNLELGNVGVLLGPVSDDLCSFDLDDDQSLSEFLGANPWFKDSFRSKGARGANIWVRIPEGYPGSGKIFDTTSTDSGPRGRPVGEFRARGNQTVVAGTHPSGVEYQIIVKSPPVMTPWEMVSWPAGWKVISKDRPKMEPIAQGLSIDCNSPLLDRARRYVDKLRPAISGERGHDRTFHAACVLVKGFDLPSAEALQILREYNQRCIPPWEESDLSYKIDEADSAPDDQPRGHLARHPLYDCRPKVRLPGPNRLLSDFARDCGKLVYESKFELFQREGLVLGINPQRDGLKCMNDIAFRTWFEQVAVPVQYRKGAEGRENVEFGKTMSRDDALGTLQSEVFWSQLPSIRRFNTVRMPVLRANGTVELLPTQYDVETQTFTEPKLEYDGEMSFESAMKTISQLYAEFCFADSGRSKAVALASLLTPFCMGLLPSGAIRPCFIATANDSGAGKGTIIKTALIPVTGHAQTQTCPNTEDEMRKSLTVAIMEARPYVFIDNVRGSLESASLEAFITAATWTDRRLGKSERIQGENLATVFISGNDFSFSPDLRRRSLFIELFLDVERAETRQFTERLDDGSLLEKRAEILAAAWALVRHWDHQGRPEASRTSSSFPIWCNIIGGIVEAAGFGCPIAEPDLTSSEDSENDDMRSLLQLIFQAFSIQTPDKETAICTRQIEFHDIMLEARKNGLFSGFLTVAPPSSTKDESVQNSKLGKLLKRFDKRMLGNGYRLKIEGRSHTRKYLVERLETHGNHGPHGH